MPKLGLFPLGVVLLPSERIPLHIFEPRYKELIGECIAQRREFGLVLVDDAGLREVGTRAAVIDVLERFPDGRLNVVVEGRERFRVLELTSGRSFQTANVEPLADDDEPVADEEAGRALELFRQLAELADAAVDEQAERSAQLSFELAARIDFDAAAKQELLETRSERTRLERVSELIERALQAIELRRVVAEHASTNGKVIATG